MMDKIRSFMIGRYGPDRLGWGLLIAYFLWSTFLGHTVLRPASLIFLVLFWFRFLSRDVYQRSRENQKFISMTDPIVIRCKKLYNRLNDRQHKYYKCPKCKQTLRVPSGAGKIVITCPRCRNTITKKT